MSDKKRRTIMAIICILISSFVLIAYLACQDSGYQENNIAKDYVLENHVSQTGAFNAVCAIYLNYRLWDTLFESMVLLISVVAVISLSWRTDDEE